MSTLAYCNRISDLPDHFNIVPGILWAFGNLFSAFQALSLNVHLFMVKNQDVPGTKHIREHKLLAA